MGVEEELKTYLEVLWRRKWSIVACAVVATVAALLISRHLTPIYSAVATVRVASAPGGATDYVAMSSQTRLSNTYVEIATSDVTLDQVASRLGLALRPKVDVEVVPETELIKITAEDPSPIHAQAIANTLGDMMVEQSTQLYGGSAPTAAQILEGQLKQAKSDLDAAVAEYDTAMRSAAAAKAGATAPAAQPTTSETDAAGNQFNPDAMARLLSVRQQIYADLLQKYESARTNEQLRANAITVIERASLPLKPSSPKIPLNVGLGLIAGLIAGVIYAFLAEGLDDSVRDVEELDTITSAPVICEVPRRKRRWGVIGQWWAGRALRGRMPAGRALRATSLISGADHVIQKRAFQQLSARLLLSDGIRASHEGAPSLLITSAEPGAGKSTIAANLAVTLAAAGRRVVLLDMDFYRPSVHSVLKLPNLLGVSDYACGKITLDAALRNSVYPNLTVGTAGGSVGELSESPSSGWIQDLLATVSNASCREYDAAYPEATHHEVGYDLVVIDAPALLAVADAAVIASQADAVLFVVAQHETRRKHLRLALQQLAELKVKVIGIVVNKTPGSHLYGYYSRRDHKSGGAGGGASATHGTPSAGDTPSAVNDVSSVAGAWRMS